MVKSVDVEKSEGRKEEREKKIREKLARLEE